MYAYRFCIHRKGLLKKFQVKYVLSACVALTCICYLGMSRATALWQFYMLSGIQGFGWAGATNLPVSIMVSNWFGPKIKGTAMSIGMLGSGAGALVWVNVISSVITNNGWRSAYLAMAGINAIMIPIALLLAVSYPSDKGFETRVGDPSPKEAAERPGYLHTEDRHHGAAGFENQPVVVPVAGRLSHHDWRLCTLLSVRGLFHRPDW